ncbi:MAG: hypothetical protein ABJA93_02940, partial [Sporichthyaceae bacterium]
SGSELRSTHPTRIGSRQAFWVAKSGPRRLQHRTVGVDCDGGVGHRGDDRAYATINPATAHREIHAL